MCDTLGVLQGSYALFGKNSDRSPNEAQITELYPARIYDGGEVACTYRLIPQARETLGVLLSRPVWMWGAEIGVNEAGVAIGNEAVFTKGKYGAPSLTGMDLLRLALERAQSAQRAVNVIIELLETYGQGGNCGFDHTFYYDNSFLITDKDKLFVLETCRKNWVVKSYPRASISNRLSIGADGERYGGGICDFAKTYSDPLYSYFSGSRQRKAASACSLLTASTEADLMRALRGHDATVANPFAQGSVSSCCMHYGGMVGDHTTASMVIHLDVGAPTVFLTGTSTPCVSLYKPYRFGNPARLPVTTPGDEAGARYWREAEAFRRALIGKIVPAEFYAERDTLETSWMADVSGNAQAMDELLTRAIDEEAAFYAKYDPSAFEKAPVKKAFVKNWAKKNAAFSSGSATQPKKKEQESKE
ncbi:MAG: hypothetical protein Q8S22_06875 [Eubacteriales bacterium]|jgi:hypothetical protein|nr:hypothetical protein [Eubacteriales bacterium]